MATEMIENEVRVFMARFEAEKAKEEAEKKARYEKNLAKLKELIVELNDELFSDKMNELDVWEQENYRCSVVFKGKEDNNYFYGIGAKYEELVYGFPSNCINALIQAYLDGSVAETANNFRFYDDRKISKECFNGEWEEICSRW